MSSEVMSSKPEYRDQQSLLDAVLLWPITAYQLALIVPFVWVILAPYYGSAVASGASIDPKSVAPFVGDGFGEFLHQWSFPILCLAGPLAIFGLVLKAFFIVHDWHKMRNLSGTIHIASGVIALFMMLFSCSIGPQIVYWLAD